jgi:hypothetical protein
MEIPKVNDLMMWNISLSYCPEVLGALQIAAHIKPTRNNVIAIMSNPVFF